MKSVIFEGESGENMVIGEVPDKLKAEAEEKRRELIETLADIDPQIEEKYLAEEPLTSAEIKAAIRRQVIALKFVPVFMGSAYKNKVTPANDSSLTPSPPLGCATRSRRCERLHALPIRAH